MTDTTPATHLSLENMGPFDTTDACRGGIEVLRGLELGGRAGALLTALEAALDTVDFVLGDLVACEQGEEDRGFSQEDCDATASATRSAFPGAHRDAQLRYARENYPTQDWQYKVANGDTKLGYEEWLQHEVESWA